MPTWERGHLTESSIAKVTDERGRVRAPKETLGTLTRLRSPSTIICNAGLSSLTGDVQGDRASQWVKRRQDMRVFCWRTFLFGLAVSCAALRMVWPGEVIAADWKERLLTEAPPKWAALEQYYAKMEASIRKIYTEKPKFNVEYPDFDQLDIRKNGDWTVFLLHRVGRASDGKRMDKFSVFGINSRYAFTLRKPEPDTEAFILGKLIPAHDGQGRKVHRYEEYEFSNVFEVNSGNCDRLSELIKNPIVTITDVRGVKRGGREMVQLSYERPIEKSDQIRGTEHGTVVLDPEHCWCVRENYAEAPDFMPARKIEAILEYGDDVDGFPILRRKQEKTTYGDGKGMQVTTWEFDKLAHRDIPESEFTLSAFGMPELQLPGEQKPNTLWRWLLGIGIALGVLAVLLRVYVKKKQALQGTEP